MFVQYDDGREQLIARGGPSLEGAEFAGGLLDGSNRVTAGVFPAALSKDYGKGQREIFHGFLPGIPAQEAAAGARAYAADVNRGGDAYAPLGTNSNSFAADVIEDRFGRRVGDTGTPGYRYHLHAQRTAPQPFDLSPLLRTAPY
ncbi:hypothetical protein [Phenylobacterium sp.]|uniref:hypothetical protein n=1 Tax=Phenylobacterium sp. TaxID=1871053 RepID=UPI0035621D06